MHVHFCIYYSASFHFNMCIFGIGVISFGTSLDIAIKRTYIDAKI